MSINPNDPRLTAYALGELPESEQTELLRELETDEAARAQLKEIQRLAEQLTENFRHEPKQELTPEQRNALLTGAGAQAGLEAAQTGSTQPANLWWRNYWKFAFPTALAAALAVGFFIFQGSQSEKEIQLAKLPELPAPTAGHTQVLPESRGEAKQIAEATSPVTETESLPELETFRLTDASQRVNESLPKAKIETRGVSRSTAIPGSSMPGPETQSSTLDRSGGQANRLGTMQLGARYALAPSEPSQNLDQSFHKLSVPEELRREKSLSDSLAPDVRENSRERVLDRARVQRQPSNTETYDSITENDFQSVNDHPLSTLSIDVDTAAYSLVRRFLKSGELPPKGAVRIEEMINYFPYSYAAPKNNQPFAASLELANCPWNNQNQIVRIALKGREARGENRPAANLVFLIDVSGSMQPANKLPLVKRALKLLVQQLREEDQVALVVYAGSSGLVLDSTPCSDKEAILEAIDRLEAGGSTNGGQGIALAYGTARRNYLPRGVNRVILCTDGDFNVGVTSQSELISMVEERAKSGVFLTVLGFGMGNLKDSTLEKLADKGNGQYGYIDDMAEARKLFVEQLSGTLVTIAKDVKIQVEFNPAQVASYRLIGYENRLLNKEDFNDDKKDAGDIGAGHTVTALYEIVRGRSGQSKVDPLKYQNSARLAPAAQGGELLTVKVRYKTPSGDTSELLEFPLASELQKQEMSPDLKFAASVAAFGMLLRDSAHKGSATYDLAYELAEAGQGLDRNGHRAEFLELITLAKELQPSTGARKRRQEPAVE